MKNYKDLPAAPLRLVTDAATASLIDGIFDARVGTENNFFLVVDTESSEVTAEDLVRLADFAGCHPEDVTVTALAEDELLIEATNTRFSFSHLHNSGMTFSAFRQKEDGSYQQVFSSDSPATLPGEQDSDDEWHASQLLGRARTRHRRTS
jgi:hypothetical protein